MHGLVVLDKPSGVSSQEALTPVKRAVPKRTRVGHAGTLDPFATGVLLGLVGDATRLAELAVTLLKTYEATARFGEATDTLDPTGEVTARADPGESPPEDLEAVAARFAGEIDQVPPAYSALKVDGRRAYALARAGAEVELAPRRVRIHSLSVRVRKWPDVSIRLTCGAGTYVRSLARDLGAELGLPARLVSLRRTAVGPFRVEDALHPAPGLTRDEVRGALLSPLAITRAAGLPELALPDDLAHLFVRGTFVPATPPGPRFAVVPEGSETLLGLGRPDGEGGTRPERVLSGTRDEFLS